jgi:hypothetical protein
MSEQHTTPYSKRVGILAEFWVDLRENYPELIRYGDLGFPLAYAISEGVVPSTPQAEKYINEIWELALKEMGIKKDTGFENIDQLIDTPRNFSK